jgi:hemerythrin-like metal-binding protein
MYLQWTDYNSVSVELFDRHHHRIVELINELYDIRQEPDSSKAKDILKEMQRYSLYHLSAEEKLFKKLCYPMAKEHIEAHDYYLEQIKLFKQALRANQPDAINQMLVFLKNWWVNHINNLDAQYSEFFNGCGVY